MDNTYQPRDESGTGYNEQLGDEYEMIPEFGDPTDVSVPDNNGTTYAEFLCQKMDEMFKKVKMLRTKVDELEATNNKILEIVVGMNKIYINMEGVVEGTKTRTYPTNYETQSAAGMQSGDQFRWATPNIQTNNMMETDNGCIIRLKDISTIIVSDDENVGEKGKMTLLHLSVVFQVQAQLLVG